ncbi:hypothetical protein E3N88_19636 [Mikania micrantha]|uniref:Endonuclease/exonuclease/phosphatase domain-containing protein n=1 Tax=Mikania micrantha TaxID=192012 RepID=A0A5N6NQF3_9ASTR|nr:hypothetical protein E3N88_19636 [Mikania micrantha]
MSDWDDDVPRFGTIGSDRGVFRFGGQLHQPDPGIGNEDVTPDTHAAQITEEVDKTIEVGNTVGIDVNAFREQIEAIIRRLLILLMDFQSINIRGVGNIAKVDWIKSIKIRNKIHFICIQETQLADCSRLPIKQIWGYRQLESDYVNAQGRSGGLLSIWDPGVFKNLGVNKGTNFLHFFGSVVGLDDVLNVVNVYAPQVASSRQVLWEALLNLMGDYNGMWILLGDFNEVRHSAERLNSDFDDRGARIFNDFIYRASLQEYRMGGMKYTYMSSDGSKFSKIDRVLVCHRFYQRWPGAKLMAHLRKWSDHSPITLQTTSEDFGPTPFKFYSSWLSIHGIDNVVLQAIVESSDDGRPDVVLVSKLRNIKNKLKEWSKERNDQQNAQLIKLNEECQKFEVLAELASDAELSELDRCTEAIRHIRFRGWLCDY